MVAVAVAVAVGATRHGATAVSLVVETIADATLGIVVDTTWVGRGLEAVA